MNSNNSLKENEQLDNPEITDISGVLLNTQNKVMILSNAANDENYKEKEQIWNEINETIQELIEQYS